MTHETTDSPTQPPDSKFEFVEIPEHHHWFWYMKNDSPWLEFRSSKETNTCDPAGGVRSWIEENANGKVFIQFGNCLNKEKTKVEESDVYDNRVIILFDEPTDYTAFKIMFPEHCRI